MTCSTSRQRCTSSLCTAHACLAQGTCCHTHTHTHCFAKGQRESHGREGAIVRSFLLLPQHMRTFTHLPAHACSLLVHTRPRVPHMHWCMQPPPPPTPGVQEPDPSAIAAAAAAAGAVPVQPANPTAEQPKPADTEGAPAAASSTSTSASSANSASSQQ